MSRIIRGAARGLGLRAAALAALLALAAGLIAACGGDDDQQQQQVAQQTPAQQQDQPSQPAPSQDEEPPAASDPLKIAFLADYSGAIAEFGPAIETGVRLAVKHLNDAGGVFGQDVQVVTGDTGLDSTRAVEEARRLIEVEGAHAIVGPLASGITLAVAESVTGPANIPTISPSATSPQITLADDNGFLFRSTVSDAAQGPVLAQLAADEGYSNVSVLYVDNAYGQGLADAFLASWGGESVSVAYAEGQTTYLAELQNVAGANGEVLIAVGYPTEAQVYIREALENNLFDTFLFVDGTKSQDLIDAIGQGFLNGMKGTAPASGPENDSLRNFNAAYEAEYGELPSIPFVREAYDAAVAIGLAAASAGSTDGVQLRDHLRMVAAPEGAVISAGAEGVAAGLRALANGESVNYEGAATTVDWNAAGDVTTGFIGVWQFAGGEIEELSVQAIDLGAGASMAVPVQRSGEDSSSDDIAPIVIAWLADYSGPLAEYGLEMGNGAQLAVDHINAAGGLLGRQVVLITGDTNTDPTRAVEEARRLVEVEGAVGIAGPVASSTTLPVGESICGPLQVPCVTPAATSPQLSLADDDGFLFRATISDAAQGPVLAQLAQDQGYQRVGVLYRDDPYGQGLAEAFAASFSGEANLVSYQPVAQPSYLAELQRAAEDDAEALVVIAFEEAQVFIREALEQGLFDQFLFVDGSKSQDLIDAIGGEYLNGMPGTAQAPGPETPSLAAWQDAYISAYGALPALPFVAESYDAAMVLMLAIEAAGSTDGAAIRDALSIVSSPGGEIVIAGEAGAAAGLAALRNGSDIDYEGAATTLDWDAVGDVTSGYIGIWRYADGGIEEVEQIPFTLE